MNHIETKTPEAENPEFSDELIGQTFGVYRITREIGRGGMGVVYLGERVDGVFRQDVAIKFVKRGMDTDSILKRFRNERQILATLSHPNVALLYDGGTTKSGLPYFVMEYVAGEPLYQYCDSRKLSLRERLNIFIKVCEAVHAAHQIKVVHRDLKPSNILVKANGTPKLLDFGIAKLLDPDLSDITIEPTATQMRMMTPEYASPEQVGGGEITTASDIYSLGVLLYELLSGHRPYRLKNRSPYEIARVICEESPESLGESLESKETFLEKSEVQTLEKVLESRDSNLEELRRELNSELEQIVMNALHKRPPDRYQTALELAEDIQLYLKDKPIKKRYTPTIKQLTLTGEGKTSLAVLPLKIIGSTLSEDTGDQYLSIGLADALVTRLSRVGRLVVRPTSSTLRFSDHTDPFEVGHDLGVEFIVDGNIRLVGNRIRVTAQLLNIRDNSTHWSESFDEQFTDVLELEDSLSEKITQSLISKLTGEEEKQLHRRGTNSPTAYEAFLKGRFYWNLQTEEGFARSIQYYQQAVQLDPNYALAYAAIAEYYIFIGIHCVIPFAQGSLAAKEAAEKAIQLDPTLAEGYAALGFSAISYEMDWNKAERLFRRAVELNENSVTAHFWYVAVLGQTKRFDEAFKQLKRVLELDPSSLLGTHMVAWISYHARAFDESIAIYEKMLKTEPNYPWGLQTYSWALRQVGRFREAILMAEKAVQLTGQNPFYLSALAAAQADAGETEKALRILANLDEVSQTRFVSEYMLTLVYCALGDKNKAFEYLEKSVSARDAWTNWLGTEPQFDILREDPRFATLLRRTGNPLAQPETSADSSTDKSIAVLPLKLIGTPTGSGEDEYLGIGLADALTTRLSNVRRLIVRPTSSVLKFDDQDANPFRAGNELGVDYVLDGNIRRVGERIRVTVQLLNVKEKSSRWAENFNELFTDVLELEDSISEKVVKSLLPKLTGEDEKQLQKRGTNSPEAYEAHLRGRYHWNQFTPETLLKAREAFENAIKFDPDYALAYVDLTDFYIWANIYGLIPSQPALAEAEKCARKAIELDDQLSEAYASLGLINQNRKRWAEAEKLKHRSIGLNPNYVHVHEWYAAQLVGLGRTEEGIREIRLAERLDSMSLRTKTLVSWTFYEARLFEESVKRGKELIDLDKNYPQGYSQLGLGLYGLGRFEESLPYFQKFDAMIPNLGITKYQLCFALVKSGRWEEARMVAEELKALAQKIYIKPYFLGMVHTALGEFDKAFGYFEESFAEDCPWMMWFGTEPMLEDLHNDERYQDLLRRMNNPLARTKTNLIKQSEKTHERKSIAVLPLKFIGEAEREDAYLSIGLADAMITRLSNVRRLIVRPTNSVLKFGDYDDFFVAGKELEVDFVLCGTIRPAGSRIRISAQLLDIKTNSTIWSDKFDEEFTDVLELEDLVAEKVAKLLVPKLTGEEKQNLAKRNAHNVEAYEAYLRGKYHLYLLTPDNFAKAISYFEKAIEIDPNYALAYVALSDCYFALTAFASQSPQDCFPLIEKMAQKAIELDDGLGDAYANLGMVSCFQFEFEKSEKLLTRGLKLNPNQLNGYVWYSVFLMMHGRYEEAILHSRKALEMDPISPFHQNHYTWTLYHTRRFEESLKQVDKNFQTEPHLSHGQGTCGWILRHLGKIDQAIELGEKAVELSPRTPWIAASLAATYAKAGETEKAHSILQKLEAEKTQYISPFCLALVYLHLGDQERSLTLLEKSVSEKDVKLWWIPSEPQLDPLRSDPRFKNLLRRMNLSPIENGYQ